MSSSALPRFVAALRHLLWDIQGALMQSLPTPAVAVKNDPRRAALTFAASLWLERVAAGIRRIVAAIQQGTLRPLRPHAGPTRGAAAAHRFTPMPRHRSWLARLLPNPEALTAAAEKILTDPELAPFLAQEPARFGRLLRPLCIALNVKPPLALLVAPNATPAPRPKLAPTPPRKPLSQAARDCLRGLFPAPHPLSPRTILVRTVFPPPPKFA